VRDVEKVIEALLLNKPAGFRNKHFAEALGVSQSRACRLLAPRVLSGELARTGEGRGKYVRGTDAGTAAGGVARGGAPGGLWSELAKDCPRLAYVALSRLALTDLRTRQQVRAALRGLDYDRHYLVVDFEGVHSISQAAAQELFLKVPRYMLMLVEPINMEPVVARIVWHVIRLGD
jgi:hypothetical protein